jgi:hypothetical protein
MSVPDGVTPRSEGPEQIEITVEQIIAYNLALEQQLAMAVAGLNMIAHTVRKAHGALVLTQQTSVSKNVRTNIKLGGIAARTLQAMKTAQMPSAPVAQALKPEGEAQ